MRSCDPDQTPCLAEEIIVVQCRECATSFGICRSCWRGQVYCRPECRESRQKRKHCQAQRRYRQKEKGKAAHREYERRRRRVDGTVDNSQEKEDPKPSGRGEQSRSVQKNSQAYLEKTMADASSSELGDVLNVVASIVTSQVVEEGKRCKKWSKCLFCGKKGVVVARFQRRGY